MRAFFYTTTLKWWITYLPAGLEPCPMSCTFDRGMCVGWRRGSVNNRCQSPQWKLFRSLQRGWASWKNTIYWKKGATHIQRGVIFIIISILNYPLKKEDMARIFNEAQGQTGFRSPQGHMAVFWLGGMWPWVGPVTSQPLSPCVWSRVMELWFGGTLTSQTLWFSSLSTHIPWTP